MEKSGKSHLVLLYNSNAMGKLKKLFKIIAWKKIYLKFIFKETLFTPSLSLTYRTIGGVLDFYFIIDESPESVLQHYHNVFYLILVTKLTKYFFRFFRLPGHQQNGLYGRIFCKSMAALGRYWQFFQEPVPRKGRKKDCILGKVNQLIVDFIYSNS